MGAFVEQSCRTNTKLRRRGNRVTSGEGDVDGCREAGRVTHRKSSIRGYCILEGWGLTSEGCTKILETVCCYWQDDIYYIRLRGFLAIALVQALKLPY